MGSSTLRPALRYLRRELASDAGNALLRLKHAMRGVRMGKGVCLDTGVRFHGGRRIRIGDHVYIGPGCRVYGEGGVRIGRGSILGPEVTVLSATPGQRTGWNPPPGLEGRDLPVRVGRGVWIGYGAMLYPGVTVGDAAVVGMASVVAEDVAAGAIVGGNPARFLKERDAALTKRLLEGERFFLKEKKEAERRRRRDVLQLMESRNGGSGQPEQEPEDS